ncbi:DUF2125 domain-containing protein [Meridianimarinicoccus aquatilis]|uniref:DUF2125 domain-containing protein n=2 Tax=Meridianimarinicoccus aquatilis TaxID=2552766 RepID=A0A4R6B3X5_9RHOB|nr:DUF2125 domain-containing protein [Fluviibacterium aquatile]
MMRIILAVILLAAAAWSGYWFIGSNAVERGLRDWFATRAAEGWVVSNTDIHTVGFPNRFDTTISDVELADPATGWAWSAPFFQTLALSYKPGHVIAVWPDTQTVATPLQKIDVQSETMRGSVVLADLNDLTLERTTIEFSDVRLSSSAGWTSALAGGQLALRRTPAAVNSYDAAFDAQDLTLPDEATGLFSRSALIGDTVQRLELDATVVFDAPWDRRAIEQQRPQPRRIELRLARARWGELDLKIAGTLDVDLAGLPTGELTVKATNWREMLTLAQAAGMIPEQLGPLVEGGFAQMAKLSGNPNTLDVPLRFDGGRISLGGVLPLGAAPRLILR